VADLQYCVLKCQKARNFAASSFEADLICTLLKLQSRRAHASC
jgi:hypothetical protein